MSNRTQVKAVAAQIKAHLHSLLGWQCPECSGVQINCYENRFGGRSEDRFECQECGAQWRAGR